MKVRIKEFDCRNGFLHNGKFWILADVGYVIGMLAMEFPAADCVWLNDLFVDPLMRRSGVARAMVVRAEFIAAEHFGAKLLSAGIDRENAASLALFESLGFVHAYSYPESTTLLYSKQLRKAEGAA